LNDKLSTKIVGSNPKIDGMKLENYGVKKSPYPQDF